MKRNRKWLWMALALVAAAVLLAVALHGKKAPLQEGNLLANGDFSRLDSRGGADGWYTDGYVKTLGYSEYSVEDGVATIVNHDMNDARFAQDVSVQPNSLYCLRGMIRAEAKGGLGANLSIADVYVFSSSVFDTNGEWEEVRLYGRTGKNQREVTVFARLGGYSGEAVGTASFRDIVLEQVERVPADYAITQWYKQAAKAPVQETEDDGTASPAWPWLLAVALLYAALCYALRGAAMHKAPSAPRPTKWIKLCGLLLLTMSSRLAIAAIIPGYGVDIGCFTAWANTMASAGARDFYSTVGFCDYPPGYILVLGLLGNIGKLLGTGATELLVKLPSILCDTAGVYVLYRFAVKRISEKSAFALALLYALCPLTFAAGAAWGQADSVMSLCVVLVVIFALEGRWAAALPMYMLSVLLKPQALMFGPLGLIALLHALVTKKEKRLYEQTAVGLGLAAAVALVVVLPFSTRMDNSDGWWLFNLYKSTMGYYDSVTVNACNYYFLLGFNWLKANTDSTVLVRLGVAVLLLGGAAYTGIRAKWLRRDRLRQAALWALAAAGVGLTLLPMSYSLLGTLVILISVAMCAALYAAGRDIRHLPLLGALLLILLCNLGVMMHERYLFPAVLLLALACVLERDWRVYLLFVLVTATTFLNVGVVLDRGIRIGGPEGHLTAPVFSITSDSTVLEYAISALACAATVLAGAAAVDICVEGRCFALEKAAAPGNAKKSAAQAEPILTAAQREMAAHQAMQPMKRLDWLVMLGVTAVYAAVALTHLGATRSPQTWWRSTSAENTVVLDLGETRAMNMLYLGGIHGSDSRFIVRVSDDGETWSGDYWAQLLQGQCFQWQYVSESYEADGSRNYSKTPLLMFGRYVSIEAQNIATTLYEVILRDPENQAVYPVSCVSGAGEHLIDEQDAFTGEPGWYNSTYFDEIYHARTAYEHYLAMQGDYTYSPYEISHPPLGKVLMAFSIGLFGMTPFGWRFAGAMAGVLMLPGMYLLGRMLTKRRLLAFGAMLLMAVDCMHFTQTRIATIDSFVVLFIIWSMVFMVYYVRMDYWRMKLWQTLVPLALSGLCMGLAIASKWTGCYAGVGLALLFFWSLYRRFRESQTAIEWLEKKHARVELNERCRTAALEIRRRPLITLAACLVFFVLVPALIYSVSYIPYFLPTGGVSIKRVIQAAQGMLWYHSQPGLGMDHPFYSPWYSWPVIGKPMWYYSCSYRPQGATETIMAFGNPAVWWGGLAGLAAVAVIWLIRHVSAGGRVTLHTRQNDMRPAILLIAFAAQYVPWVLVPRGTYIYHYFPSVPFIILCTMLCLDLLFDRNAQAAALSEKGEIKQEERWLQWLPLGLTLLYLAAAVGLFAAFFPYASGVMTSNGWLRAMQWFDGWLYY